MKDLPKKVIIGVDGTSSMTMEYRKHIKGMLLRLFEMKNEYLMGVGLPEERIQIKIVFYTNYSSGKEHLRIGSSFVS